MQNTGQRIPLDELIRNDPNVVILRDDQFEHIDERPHPTADQRIGNILKLGTVAAGCLLAGLGATVAIGGHGDKHSATADIKHPAVAPVKPGKKTEEKSAATPATEFHALPTACEPSVTIGVDSITPVQWLVKIDETKIYQPQKDNFPAVLKGSAKIISCLTDTSAYKIDEEATKRSGVQTYNVDASKASYVLDTTELASKIRSYPNNVILQALLSQDSTATRYDAMRLNQFLQANATTIETNNINNLLSGLSASYATEILNMVKTDLMKDILATAEDEGIPDGKIAFKFTNLPADILPLSYKKSEVPATDAFTYLSQEAVTKVTIKEVLAETTQETQ
jgi:hypothetical protein